MSSFNYSQPSSSSDDMNHQSFMVATPEQTSSSTANKLFCPTDQSRWNEFELKVKTKALSEGFWKHLAGTNILHPLFPIVKDFAIQMKRRSDGSYILDPHGNRQSERNINGDEVLICIGSRQTVSAEYTLAERIKFQNAAEDRDEKESKLRSKAMEFLIQITSKTNQDVIFPFVKFCNPYGAWKALVGKYEGITENERRFQLDAMKNDLPSHFNMSKNPDSHTIRDIITAIDTMKLKYGTLPTPIVLSDTDMKHMFLMSLPKEFAAHTTGIAISSPDLTYEHYSRRLLQEINTKEFQASLNMKKRPREDEETISLLTSKSYKNFSPRQGQKFSSPQQPKPQPQGPRGQAAFMQNGSGSGSGKGSGNSFQKSLRSTSRTTTVNVSIATSLDTEKVNADNSFKIRSVAKRTLKVNHCQRQTLLKLRRNRENEKSSFKSQQSHHHPISQSLQRKWNWKMKRKCRKMKKI